jgi:hypothetical protein
MKKTNLKEAFATSIQLVFGRFAKLEKVTVVEATEVGPITT